MGRKDDQVRAAQRAAIQAWSENATADQASNATEQSLAASYGVSPQTAADFLRVTRRRHNLKGDAK